MLFILFILLIRESIFRFMWVKLADVWLGLVII
jgi:hypothetical protein